MDMLQDLIIARKTGWWNVKAAALWLCVCLEFTCAHGTHTFLLLSSQNSLLTAFGPLSGLTGLLARKILGLD